VDDGDMEGKYAQYTDAKLAAANFAWADKVMVV